MLRVLNDIHLVIDESERTSISGSCNQDTNENENEGCDPAKRELTLRAKGTDPNRRAEDVHSNSSADL